MFPSSNTAIFIDRFFCCAGPSTRPLTSPVAELYSASAFRVVLRTRGRCSPQATRRSSSTDSSAAPVLRLDHSLLPSLSCTQLRPFVLFFEQEADVPLKQHGDLHRPILLLRRSFDSTTHFCRR